MGATGNAGQLAVQVAKLLGASAIIGAGRRADRLTELSGIGATDTVLLDSDNDETAHRLGTAATHVDVVLDYLWGEPTAAAMVAVVTGRADRAKPLTWIEVGSVAGPTAAIPSAALRAARLQIVGSGQGAVTTGDILAELPALAEHITHGAFLIDPQPTLLADVQQAWASVADTRSRIVFVPRLS